MLEVGNDSRCEWTVPALSPGLWRGGQVLLDCLNHIGVPSLRLDQLVGSSQPACGLGLG